MVVIVWKRGKKEMTNICLICGNHTEKHICEKCKSITDLEKLCNDIIAYIPGKIDNPDANPTWEEIAQSFDSTKKFSELAFELAEEELESPRKEYHQVHSIVGEYSSIIKGKRNWFYEVCERIINEEGISNLERNRLKGLLLDSYCSDYKYFDAENIAAELVIEEDLPWQAYSSLADFLIKTRRYDEAEEVIEKAKAIFDNNGLALNKFQKLITECEKYRTNQENGKKEYIPCPKENKEQIVKGYYDYLKSIGIDADIPKSIPKPITKAEYPEPVIINEPYFDSFVAYDFETTGFSSSLDCIIEVGAVKVVNGVVVDSKEFIFSEYVKPFKSKITSKITEITGITSEDVENSRQMWEVISDFMKFVGDDVLVGYNNASFDSKFLARAGRYAHVIVKNPQFDVYKYIVKAKDTIGYKGENCRLTTLAEYYGIENPMAHRAWADALTTARVYMKLKEL